MRHLDQCFCSIVGPISVLNKGKMQKKNENKGKMLDEGASTTYIGNSILIMENSYLGGCETLETPNMFLNPNI